MTRRRERSAVITISKWYEILIALGVAAVCGGTAVASVLRSYGLHGEDKRMAANLNSLTGETAGSPWGMSWQMHC